MVLFVKLLVRAKNFFTLLMRCFAKFLEALFLQILRFCGVMAWALSTFAFNANLAPPSCMHCVHGHALSMHLHAFHACSCILHAFQACSCILHAFHACHAFSTHAFHAFTMHLSRMLHMHFLIHFMHAHASSFGHT